MPHAKATQEGEVIAAEAGIFRQALQFARIAAADDDIVGFQQRAQLRHDLADGPAPFLAAQTLQAARMRSLSCFFSEPKK